MPIITTWKRTVLLGLSIVPLLSGIFGILGWTIDREVLSSVGEGWVPMAPSTALLFITLSLTYILHLHGIKEKRTLAITGVLTVLIIIIAFILFILALLNIQLDIEYLGLNLSSSYQSGIGHMSPVSALLFTVLGTSFMIIRIFRRTSNSLIIPTALSGFAALLSMVFIGGYLVGKPLLYGLNIVPPAFLTCFNFLSLSVALMLESFFHERDNVVDAISVSKNQFENAFEHSAVGKTMIYMDGKFHANIAFADMLGYSTKELSTVSWQPLTHPDDLEMSQSIMERMINDHVDSYRFEKRYLHKNGQIIWVDLQSYLQRDTSGKPLYFITSASNINESKALQEQLIKAKEEAERSNQLKDAFIANMSHEIRTPLNAILGFSDLIRDELDQSGSTEFEGYFDIIRSSGSRLMRTVDMILNVSRIQVGAYEPHPVLIKLDKLINDLVIEYRLAAANKGLTIEFVQEVDHPQILADEYCILHAVSNLIDNAIKYTHDGLIELRLYQPESSLICMDIRDTGIGISEEFLTQIFQPFTQEESGFTRKFEGIGLGLSIAFRLLAVTESKLLVNSKKGIGTTFTIQFPL